MPIAGDAVGGFRGHRGRGNHQQNQQQPVPRRPGGQQNPYNPPPQAPGIGRAASRTTGAVSEPPVIGNVQQQSVSSVCRGEREQSRRPYEERGPVTRPSGYKTCGTNGQPIDIRANYFQLVRKMDMHLLQYRVDFTPDVENRGVRNGLVRQHEQLLGKYSFDGTLLYNITRLAQPLELASVRRSDGSVVMITFRLVGEIHKVDKEYTKVMNVIFRRCLAMLNLVLVKRDYYDSEAAENVPNHRITIWPGYKTTIDRHETDHLLLAEIIHKFLRQDTALNVMDKLRQAGLHDIENRIKAELVGKIVMTAYNKKTYRIDDVDFNQNASSTFHLIKEDRDITYAEYYRTRYQQTIRVLSQPLLVSRPTRRDINRGDNASIFLVPELCGMTGLSDEHRKNFQLTREIGGITRVPPDARVRTLLKFRQRLGSNPAIQAELNSWGLEFANKLYSCKGRVLQAARIIIGGHSPVPVRDGDWSRTMQNARMPVTVAMKNWVVLHPIYMAQPIRSFVQLMKKVGMQVNFIIPEPNYVSLPMDRSSNYSDALNNELSSQDYDLVMCVLKTNRADIYKVIKKITLCQKGICSQVITGRILQGDERRQMSVATKVMTQIACKLGAEPWQVQIPNKPWMIVGYDTYHDARQRTAVGAFVASTNRTYTRFNSSVKIHSANEEICNSFREHTLVSLKAYFIANNKTLPENIIVYRDGIGTGDIRTVLEVEVGGIKAACAEAGRITSNPNYKPGIAFVIVSKRINTRLFSVKKDGRTGDEISENPPCGTVVDNGITFDDRYDFFLISQKVNQGTVSPTSFNVIYNSAGLTPDIHQSMAYALTQLYYNWAGTLCVPAPVQYAHKLAYLVGEHMDDQLPKENLARFPYYL